MTEDKWILDAWMICSLEIFAFFVFLQRYLQMNAWVTVMEMKMLGIMAGMSSHRTSKIFINTVYKELFGRVMNFPFYKWKLENISK